MQCARRYTREDAMQRQTVVTLGASVSDSWSTRDHGSGPLRRIVLERNLVADVTARLHLILMLVFWIAEEC